MKKISLYSLLIVSLYLPMTVFALGCNDLLGVWRGNLGNLTFVKLTIHRITSGVNATIDFNMPGGGSLYGFEGGNCKVENEKVVLYLSKNDPYSNIRAELNAQLAGEKTLSVTSFTYAEPTRIGSGSGTLTKS